MAQLASETIMAVEQLAVDDDARADARAKCDDDEILHATGYAVDHLAQGRSIGVVGHGHGNVAETLAEHLGQGNDAVVCPRQVRRKLDGAFIVVGIGSADAHGLDFLQSAHLLDDGLQCHDAGVDIVLGLLVATGLDGCRGLDVAACVNDSKHGVRAS